MSLSRSSQPALAALLLIGCAASSSPVRQGSFALDGGRFECTPGTLCAPHAVEKNPFEVTGTFAEASSQVVHANSCDWDRRLEGPEDVYEIQVLLPSILNVQAWTHEDAGVYVFDRDDGDACLGGGEGYLGHVGPGRYLVLVDSAAGSEGSYDLFIETMATSVQDDRYEPNDDRDAAYLYASHLYFPDEGTLPIRGTLTADSPIDMHFVWIESFMQAGFDGSSLPEGLTVTVQNEAEETLTLDESSRIEALVDDPSEDAFGVWVILELEDPETPYLDYTFRFEP